MTPENTHNEKRLPGSRRGARRRSIRFVVLFVVYVLALLVGYRYAINSEANMWYLYQVAKHTSTVLDAVGEKSELQPSRRSENVTEIRAQLAAWRQGVALAAADDTAADRADDSTPAAAPLTRYERWLYTAYVSLNSGKTLAELGPTVKFTAAPGLERRIKETEKAWRETTQLAHDSPARRRLEPKLLDRLNELQQRRAALPNGRRDTFERFDRGFTFIVVPSCGAIELFSIFIAAVLAFPTGWAHRVIGLVVGVPVMYGLNLLRLSTLAYIAAYDPTPGKKWFHFFHEYVWQGVFIVFVVVVWLCWIEFLVQRKRRPA